MGKFNDKIDDFLELFRMKEEDGYTEVRNDLEAYKKRVQKKKRKRFLTVAAIVAITVFGALTIHQIMAQKTYDSYKVVEMSEQLDSSVLHYIELGNGVLRYSGDGVSFMKDSDEPIWNDSIQMTNPHIVCFDQMAAVYETKGTIVEVYNTDGKVGSVKTDHPILKTAISSKGGVAVILENGENTLINYYTSSGSLVASCSTNMQNPGYPMDVTVSENGLSMAVTYLVAENGKVSSYLALYNFGDAGKNKEDNLLDGTRFDSLIVPKVQYLNDKTLLVYRENGFTLYNSGTLLEEIKNVTFEKEIVSSFGDGELFGFVFLGNEHAFEMKVYDKTGNIKTESEFDISYDKIKISDDQIILHNSSQFAMIASNGVVRYSGNFEEGNILDIVKRGRNRYSVACSKGIARIELK